jgi:xylulokinase
MARYLLGFDISSSFIHTSIIDIESGRAVYRSKWPEHEMTFFSLSPGFAEQNPDDWWDYLKKALSIILKQNPEIADEVAAIGISYQMNGMVLVDKWGKPLRPAIIWCDSRAVSIGDKALNDIGKRYCLNHYLNAPVNFNGARLKWIKENEPEIFSKIFKILLPGEYIAYKMTGSYMTTLSALSEEILYDYIDDELAKRMLSYFEIPHEIIPDIGDNFAIQGSLTSQAAEFLGLCEGIPVAFRAGDLLTNAFSLNVVYPGDVAVKTGMSGTIYGISDTQICDTRFRLSTFVNYNHSKVKPSYGIVHCVNGTGMLNRWLNSYLLRYPSDETDINVINKFASRVGAGSEGLLVFPFGNGTERSLGNINMGMVIHGLDFSKHSTEHIVRASQEGIVFSLYYGMEIMRDIGVEVRKVRAINSNLFTSTEFCEAFVSITGTKLELYETDDAEGAARAAGIGSGIYKNHAEAFSGFSVQKEYYPDLKLSRLYSESYNRWKKILVKYLETPL